jgi:hypothetical protein
VRRIYQLDALIADKKRRSGVLCSLAQD